MRRQVLAALLAVVACTAATGCTTQVAGAASPAATSGVESGGPLPGGAEPSCRIDCGDDDEPADGAVSGVVCAPLPDAMLAFDRALTDLPADRAPLGIVRAVVAVCGFQVMADVANQYPGSLYDELMTAAVLALGPLGELPPGLLCRDLVDRGYGSRDAVDYWFLWGGPAEMDADLDGVPCETVFVDVPLQMPQYY